jgi:hypothetical protein
MPWECAASAAGDCARDDGLFRKTVLLASALGMLARVLLTEPPVQAWWA